VALAPESVFLKPMGWRTRRRVFVNSMGDLFHENVPDAWIDRVFAVMALCPQHTFQVLTKRSARMRAYLSQNDMAARVAPIGARMAEHGDHAYASLLHGEWPLPNVWLGVSAEDQPRADERVPDLLATPAAVRFVSAEPLLGPVDFCSIDGGGGYRFNALHRAPPFGHAEFRAGLDWVIVGGESGPGARPMHPEWARSIRGQCTAAGTAFFFKQWGAWAPAPEDDSYAAHRKRGGRDYYLWPDLVASELVGKTAAGRTLDGRTLDGRAWDEFPEGRA
jgi:protein gp37